MSLDNLGMVFRGRRTPWSLFLLGVNRSSPGRTTWHPVHEGLVLSIVLQLFLHVCRLRMSCNFAIYLSKEGQTYLRYSCYLLGPKFSWRGLSVDFGWWVNKLSITPQTSTLWRSHAGTSPQISTLRCGWCFLWASAAIHAAITSTRAPSLILARSAKTRYAFLLNETLKFTSSVLWSPILTQFICGKHIWKFKYFASILNAADALLS